MKKIVSLPKVSDDTMVFRKIENVTKLEKGNFNISEPKENCPIEENHDIILVPCIGLDNNGNRLGYGYGFYDKYLTKNNPTKIALTYSKQIVKSIPTSKYDVKMDWVVTETDIIKTS
uniref:5-formyltetrahydrofolate cyclo-ligase n=2 Tax=environmental samples TaxID=651140 RepID=A0A075FS39_9ARCH|nr:5-formyltetrahydrofolate cyclo-ligase [uncultured marine thaumarchaeote AD1000_46_C12]AIE94528.1 5-formyltetrahydrofolate cyclo-ligase [uncultured marine thaumarchaeote AD1000_46_F05]